MKRVVVLRLLVDVVAEHPSTRIGMASNKAIQRAAEAFKQFEVSVEGMEFSFTKPTKEESMRLVPKKIHYGFHNVPSCSEKRSVPNSRLTEDWKKVTCRPCLKHRPKTMQTELFS